MGTDTAQPQQQPTTAEPQKEHKWLDQLLGEWTYESEAQEPGGASHKASGTESVRSIGGLWVVAEGQGDDVPCAIMTLGFDPQKGRFVGTWIGSMMTNMWVYDGSLDEAKHVLTLDCEGPAMSGDGSLANYRDVIEIDGEKRIQRSYAQSTDGSWQQFMTSTYRRK